MDNLSGEGAAIYSVILEDHSITLFENFIQENIATHKKEVFNIVNRVKSIGEIGARVNFFKEKEGKPGDLVCALYDDPDSNLRLYCIRYGTMTLLLGGGGYKPKTIRALQQDPKLKEENELMRIVSNDILKRIKEGEIEWSKDGKELIGNLKFKDEHEEE
jgi:hypothetical protein